MMVMGGREAVGWLWKVLPVEVFGVESRM